MRIGIIDDDQKFLNMFKEVYYPKIINLSNDDENSLTCSTEMLASEVLNTLDLVFFDIQLKDKNSITLIAEAESKFDTKIVFISSKNDLVFDALRVRPLTFIRKNNLEDDFKMFLTLFEDEIVTRRTISLTNQYGRVEKVYIDHILYFTACGHDVSVVAINETYRLISSLKKMLFELQDKRFVQIEKSTCVNMKHILEITNDNVIMKNRNVIPICRYFRKEIQQRYLDYLLNERI